MFPVPKILVIDVIVVLDVVLDVALLKIYCLHIIRTLSAFHLHIVCMSSTHHLYMHMSYAHHLQMHMSFPTVLVDPNPEQSPLSLWTPIVFPVPKILIIDVTVVPDVVSDVVLLKDILSAHHPEQSPLSLWTPIVFLVPKILVIDVTGVPDVVPDVALLQSY